MGKPPIPFWDTYGLAVFGVAAVGLIAVVVANLPPPVERNQAGIITNEGAIDAFRMRVGDCFNDEAPLSAQTPGVDTEVTTVPGVPCSEPHDNEVFAVFDLSLAAFPGQDQIREMAKDSCLERFEAFVGREYEESVLDVTTLHPTSESWTQQTDREIICGVYHMDLRRLTGTMEGSEL